MKFFMTFLMLLAALGAQAAEKSGRLEGTITGRDASTNQLTVAPMHMTMTEHGDWMLMLHGLAFVNQVVQSGPRGGDKLFSTNWGMAMAERPLGGGHLMFRSMLSLEPLTVGRKYPELFQTGEQ